MSQKIIKLSRGSSFEFPINLKNNNEEKYLLATDEVVYFALLYPNQPFEEALLVKGYTRDDQDSETGLLEIKISPSDTASLASGIYYYCVKLKKGGNPNSLNDFASMQEFKTLIERTKFIINE